MCGYHVEMLIKLLNALLGLAHTPLSELRGWATSVSSTPLLIYLLFFFFIVGCRGIRLPFSLKNMPRDGLLFCALVQSQCRKGWLSQSTRVVGYFSLHRM